MNRGQDTISSLRSKRPRKEENRKFNVSFFAHRVLDVLDTGFEIPPLKNEVRLANLRPGPVEVWNSILQSI